MDKINWQEGYYIGKEYIEDPEKIEAIIQYCIKMPVRFEDFNISVSKDIKIIQGKGELLVNIEKTVSRKLFYDIVHNISKAVKDNDIEAAKTYVNAGRFVVGYISSSFPLIIDEIQKKKYLEGHLLVRTISLPEIIDVAIVSKENKKEGAVITGWPIPMPPFPPSKFLAKEADAIFIRDFIEAITCYFGYDINEGIRKIITSLENYWISYNLKKKNKSFKELVDLYIVEENYAYKEHNLKIIRKNIKYIYDIRNSIVHNKLRLKANDIYLLKIAIGSLSYVYQGKLIHVEHFNYVFSLTQQFIGIDHEFNGLNLDYGEKQKETAAESKGFVIKNKEDMDDYMFDGLNLTSEYVNEINTNYSISLKY